MFIWTVIKRCVGIGAVVLGLVFFGMKGLLAGVVFNYWFSYFVNISLVSKHIGYKWYQQIKDLLPVGLVSLAIAAICYAIEYFLHLGLYAEGAIVLVVYLILYIGWSVVVKPEAYKYFLSVIPNKFKFLSKRKKSTK